MLDLSALGYIESEIVEMPVIIVDNKAKLLTPGMKDLPEKMLQDMAKLMGGKLGWKKMRVEFSNPEAEICLHRGCWAIARYADNMCSDHTVLSTTQTVTLS